MSQRVVIDVRKLDVFSILNDEGIDGERPPVCRAVTTPCTPEIEDQLWDAYQWRDDVTLRCAALEVSGIITKTLYAGVDKIYELKVDNIVYD